ncbi:MAG: hypothetical protein R3C26_25245 [Calditrichia bacterium]
MKYRYLWIMIVWVFLYLSGAAGFGFPDENGSDWTQMRGSARDGISAETKLPDSCLESGPAEVWRKKLATVIPALPFRVIDCLSLFRTMAKKSCFA